MKKEKAEPRPGHTWAASKSISIRIIDGEAQNMVGGKVRKLRMEQKMSRQTLSDQLETMAI